MSGYIKKEDAISKILIEFVAREEKGNVICACAEAKQTCADILDGLPTYSFPDSENNGEWIPVIDSYYEDGSERERHWECSKCGSDKSGWGEFKFCPDCGADMRGAKAE